MSIRNQLRTVKGILAHTTGALLAKETRASIASFDLPENQNQPAFPTVDGRWLTVAQIKEHFGPTYATNPTVIEQVLAAYIGRLVNKAIEEVGLDVRACTPDQLEAVFGALVEAEKNALVRMTTN